MRKLLLVFVLMFSITGCFKIDQVDNNVYTIINKATVLDENNQEVFEAFDGFNIDKVKDDKDYVYFTMNVQDDKGTILNKELKVSHHDVRETYLEPKAMIEVISTDLIQPKLKAKFYDVDSNNVILEFNKPFPYKVHYVTTNKEGYVLKIGGSIGYFKYSDVNLVKVKE